MTIMKTRSIALLAVAAAVALSSCGKATGGPEHYFFLNSSVNEYNYDRIASVFGPQDGQQKMAVGNAILVYILSAPLEEQILLLDKHFALSEQYGVPVLLELDPISFWDAMPQLWNWWDPQAPGYDPANRENVEWSDWGSENALKLGWLNWGSQMRIKPMANLYSPKYQEVVKTRMASFLDHTYKWYKSLPRNRKWLLAGIKITGELGFGMNNWAYPDANSYFDKPAEDDPKYGLNPDVMPFRGVGPIGYASLSYSGIRTEGEVTPQDIYDLEWKYSKFIADLCQGHGFPREMLFSHSGGWKDDMAAAVQDNTCPSWSFYWDQAVEPRLTDHMKYLATSDAPYFGMSEWNHFLDDYPTWKKSIENGFKIPRCRFISLFNFDSIFKKDGTVNENAVRALKEFQDKSLSK